MVGEVLEAQGSEKTVTIFDVVMERCTPAKSSFEGEVNPNFCSS